MLPARILNDPVEVGARLEQLFGVTKDELVRVAHAVLMARNESVSVDPMNAKGQLMYIRGTREIRSVFMRKGWVIDRTGNIEATFSEERGAKIIYQNADSASDPTREPRAISGKGPAAVRMVEDGQMFIFPEWEAQRRRQREEARKRDSAAAWFFCASVNGEEIVAELSCPRAVEGDQFKGFHERIFIIAPGEWGGFDLSKFEPEGQDFDVVVTRK
ncbi:MAG TPA: hypothetical protein VFY10_08410 [Dehalococcoidia bacterium]|nr:hypothetical protein [Dehalococcoidia bacterium]